MRYKINIRFANQFAASFVCQKSSFRLLLLLLLLCQCGFVVASLMLISPNQDKTNKWHRTTVVTTIQIPCVGGRHTERERLKADEGKKKHTQPFLWMKLSGCICVCACAQNSKAQFCGDTHSQCAKNRKTIQWIKCCSVFSSSSKRSSITSTNLHIIRIFCMHVLW